MVKRNSMIKIRWSDILNSKYKIFITFILLLTLAIILYIHYAPVNFDAGSCSRGYKRWILEKFSSQLVNMFMEERGISTNLKYEIIDNYENEDEQVTWDDRKIYIALRIKIDSNIYTVKYEGKRYWIERYKWKISDTNLL